MEQHGLTPLEHRAQRLLERYPNTLTTTTQVMTPAQWARWLIIGGWERVEDDDITDLFTVDAVQHLMNAIGAEPPLTTHFLWVSASGKRAVSRITDGLVLVALMRERHQVTQQLRVLSGPRTWRSDDDDPDRNARNQAPGPCERAW